MKEREAFTQGEIFPKQSATPGSVRGKRAEILHGSGARGTGQQQRPQGHVSAWERDLQGDGKAAAVLLQPRKARTAGGGGAETAEPTPLKKREQRLPRGERPERAPRPERSPKPERGPRPERGERPPRPERGPRPPKKQADRPQDKEAPVKPEQPVVEEQKAVEAIDVLEIREDAKKEDLF